MSSSSRSGRATPPSSIRAGGPDDLAWALRLNNAAEPAVNGLTAHELRTLVGWAESFLVVEHMDRPAGFVLALEGPGVPYESLNYRWFSSRFDAFLYVDRVVVDAGVRSGGLGGALYGALAATASGRWPRICAEVNVKPANAASRRFHERFGFRPLGQQDTEGGAKRVELLELRLDEEAGHADAV